MCKQAITINYMEFEPDTGVHYVEWRSSTGTSGFGYGSKAIASRLAKGQMTQDEAEEEIIPHAVADEIMARAADSLGYSRAASKAALIETVRATMANQVGDKTTLLDFATAVVDDLVASKRVLPFTE